MDIVVRRGEIGAASADVVVLPVFERETWAGSLRRPADRGSRELVSALMRSGDFAGRFLETALLHPVAGRPRRVLVVGLGAREEATPHRLRQAAAVAARRARELGARTLAMPLVADDSIGPERSVQALAEGVMLGPHRFTRYRGEPGPAPLERVQIVVSGAHELSAVRAAADRGAQWGRAVCETRDLANTPGQDLTPEGLAQTALEVARAGGARARVLGVGEMEELGAGAVLAVGRGSIHPPRLIVIERDPGSTRSTANAKAPGATAAPAARPAARARGTAAAPEAATIVLIGKGVTFDTGGISLKPRDSMANMKYDMSGAAAVLGVFAALPSLDLPFSVVGLIPAAENMPGGAAFKPGDVVRAMDGTTIEVTNTDAEGRLLLADALCYARRYQPEVVVDVATLTGAIRLALGPFAAGLFTADDALARELETAAAESGERLWRMPLWSDYTESLRSDVADLVNSAGPEGAASVAASFLARFAKGYRWGHLDVASTAWAPADRPHESRGPTGYGVRLLLTWLEARARRGEPRLPDRSRAHAEPREPPGPRTRAAPRRVTRRRASRPARQR